MAIVEVSVDLDDLMNNVAERPDGKEFLMSYEQKALDNLVKVINRNFNLKVGDGGQSLRDVLYNEFIEEIRNKYSQDELELMINTFKNKKS
jgi:hypothetical protein